MRTGSSQNDPPSGGLDGSADRRAPRREAVVEALREAIMSGQLVDGERLIEDRIARELRTSRGPVRDALKSVVAPSHVCVWVAVLWVGGSESLIGAVVSRLGLGLVECLTRFFYPEESNIVVFVIMVIVLMVRQAGVFGKEA